MPPQVANETRRVFKLTKRSGVSSGAAELAVNPRARSARLRFALRTDAPAWADVGELAQELLPSVPALDVLRKLAS